MYFPHSKNRETNPAPSLSISPTPPSQQQKPTIVGSHTITHQGMQPVGNQKSKPEGWWNFEAHVVGPEMRPRTPQRALFQPQQPTHAIPPTLNGHPTTRPFCGLSVPQAQGAAPFLL